MKLKEFIPTMKPGLILALINTALCAIFAFCAALAVGGSAIIQEIWNLALPLLPIVVLGATPAAILAWLVFGYRIRQSRRLRYVIAAIGTLPLIGIVALTVNASLWLASIPGAEASFSAGSLASGLIALAATITCVVCVAWARPVDPDLETEPG